MIIRTHDTGLGLTLGVHDDGAVTVFVNLFGARLECNTLPKDAWTDAVANASARYDVPGQTDVAAKLHAGEELKTRAEYDAENPVLADVGAIEG